ncbi:hypothetical protein GCM10008094_27020 [Aidingimonas halophila]|nr:hypothetical protein GCM10008094_27020 [Aidingimonas halophila]
MKLVADSALSKTTLASIKTLAAIPISVEGFMHHIRMEFMAWHHASVAMPDQKPEKAPRGALLYVTPSVDLPLIPQNALWPTPASLYVTTPSGDIM